MNRGEILRHGSERSQIDLPRAEQGQGSHQMNILAFRHP
jgi:hypothetical protein